MYNKNIDIIIIITLCIISIFPIIWPIDINNLLLEELRYIRLLDSKDKIIKLLKQEIETKNKIINNLEKTNGTKNK